MFSMPDLLVILAVVLIIFGPGKLPHIGDSMGKAIRGFKKAVEEDEPETQKIAHEPQEKAELSKQDATASDQQKDTPIKPS